MPLWTKKDTSDGALFKPLVDGSGIDFSKCEGSLSQNNPECEFIPAYFLNTIACVGISVITSLFFLLLLCLRCCGFCGGKRKGSHNGNVCMMASFAINAFIIIGLSAYGIYDAHTIPTSVDGTADAMDGMVGDVVDYASSGSNEIVAAAEFSGEVVDEASRGVAGLTTLKGVELPKVLANFGDMVARMKDIGATATESQAYKDLIAARDEVAAMSAAIPDVAEALDADKITAQLKDSVKDFSKQIDAVIKPLNETRDDIKSTRSDLEPYVDYSVYAVSGLFGFAVLAVLVGALGMCTGSRCLLWMTFALGWFWLFFGWIVLGVFLPAGNMTGDFCPLLPTEGDASNDWYIRNVKIISDPIVNDVIKTCVMANSGDLLAALKVDTAQFDDAVKTFNLEELLGGDALGKLNATYFDDAAAKLEEIANMADSEFVAMEGSLLLQVAATPQQNIDNIKRIASETAVLVRGTIKATAAELQSNVTALVPVLTAKIQGRIDELKDIGKPCSWIGKSYENVKDNLCSGVGANLDSVWFVLLTCLPAMFTVCMLMVTAASRGDKHAVDEDEERIYRTRGGPEEQQSLL